MISLKFLKVLTHTSHRLVGVLHGGQANLMKTEKTRQKRGIIHTKYLDATVEGHKYVMDFFESDSNFVNYQNIILRLLFRSILLQLLIRTPGSQDVLIKLILYTESIVLLWNRQLKKNGCLISPYLAVLLYVLSSLLHHPPF